MFHHNQPQCTTSKSNIKRSLQSVLGVGEPRSIYIFQKSRLRQPPIHWTISRYSPWVWVSRFWVISLITIALTPLGLGRLRPHWPTTPHLQSGLFFDLLPPAGKSRFDLLSGCSPPHDRSLAPPKGPISPTWVPFLVLWPPSSTPVVPRLRTDPRPVPVPIQQS